MKQIQWFPGHMKRALIEIQERIKVVDIVIELVDARAPMASRNPELDKIINNKPRLIVMTKKDLANVNRTNEWIQYFKQHSSGAIAVDANNFNYIEMKKICLDVLKEKMEKEKAKGLRPRAIRAMICGIPNVGKSTLINKMAKKRATVVGNMPGVTKAQQWVKIDKDFELLDTPGVLWPSFENHENGIKLALLGTIKDTILPSEELIYYLVKILTNEYQGSLKARYEIEEKPCANEIDVQELLQLIGVKRGYLVSGGFVDISKVIFLVLKEFRDGVLGKFCLEKARDF